MPARLIVFALVIATFTASNACGEVIFSNLNSDPAHLYYGFGGSGASGSFAWPFTVSGSSTFMLTQIDLALQEDLGGSLAAVLTLAADANGVPGVALDSWTVTHLRPFSHIANNCCTLATLLVQDSAIFVTAGSTYWLAVTPIGPTVADIWLDNNTGSSGLFAHTDRFGNWISNFAGTVGAFDVLGVAATPEPSSIFMLLAGTTILALWRYKSTIRS